MSSNAWRRLVRIGVGLVIALLTGLCLILVLPFFERDYLASDVRRFLEENFTDVSIISERVEPKVRILFSDPWGLWEVRFGTSPITDQTAADEFDKKSISEIVLEFIRNTDPADFDDYTLVRGQLSGPGYDTCPPESYCKFYFLFESGHGFLVVYDR